MRTYGTLYAEDGTYTWVEVDTTPQNQDDFVWLTTLIQCLLLGRGESPFYSNYGIPAQQSLIQQIFPDYYVSLTQSQFAPYFASLIVNRRVNGDPQNPGPIYDISVTTNQGVKKAVSIPV